jgi:hypothetical protein
MAAVPQRQAPVNHRDKNSVRRNGQTWRSHWPRGLKAAARLLGLRVRILPDAWLFVSCTCVVLCQVEVYASGWSLVPRRPSECGVSEYDCGTSTMGGLGPLWLSRHGRKMDTHTISWHRCAVMPPTCDTHYRMCHNQFLVILSVNLFSVSMKHEFKKKSNVLPWATLGCFIFSLSTKFYLSACAWVSKCF